MTQAMTELSVDGTGLLILAQADTGTDAPTDAGTERFCPDNQRAATPPTSASGMLSKMSIALRTDWKLLKSSRKTARRVIGTTKESRRFASCCSRNCPPHVTRYPGGKVTASVIAF